MVLEVPGQQGGPWLLQHSASDGSFVIFNIDADLLQEEPVAQSSDLRAAKPVELVAAADEGERHVQRVLNAGEDHGGGGEDALRLATLGPDALLLLPGQVLGDSAGYNAPRQSAALLLQLSDALTGVVKLGLGSALLAVQLSTQVLPDGCL
ncbi:hypothetical protein LWC34_27820 [Kibdelosporangium philippinense]|uniref:Uncharacterized protein n=1 Tax=Kibdelosporangium philippinense TaxID=211113 RepID=A0ABS8ZH05_9PSEU|nr:hypothetical protein [Kibdelosporangium philippinense]MCE7006609.1 hypothetical protein [Kibdelosporangium philippinense]